MSGGQAEFRRALTPVDAARPCPSSQDSGRSAHREWASRPPDERYASVHALYEAARARRDRIEERPIETGDYRTEAIDDDLVIRESSGRTRPARRTHWRNNTSTNPRSIWGYVQGLTRLSQRTPWQDGRFILDRAASRLLTTVH